MENADGELVSAVLNGAFETPLWGNFLTLLRQRTGAHTATLVFRPPNRPFGEALHLHSSEISSTRMRQIYANYMASPVLFSGAGMTDGQVYTLEEIYPPRDAGHQAWYRDVVLKSGVRSVRVLRVTEQTGVSAMLAISHHERDFDQADGALLQSIAPVLRGSLCYYVALERERFAASVTGDAMRHLHFGWMSLDAEGRILDLDPEAASALDQSNIISSGPARRLSAQPPHLDREIHEAIRRLAQDPHSRPHAITLSQDPWLDMLLVRNSRATLSAEPQASILAYVHGDSWRSADRRAQLGQLFGLTPSESKLALALAQGRSLAEASSTFGLSIETVRSYSKSIYSKTGARGLADLVRIVMRSVLVFAPER